MPKEIIKVKYETDKIVLSFPFIQNLVTALRDEVPLHHRRWDKNNSVWLLHPFCLSYLPKILQTCYDRHIAYDGQENIAHLESYRPVTLLRDMRLELGYLGKVYRRNRMEESAMGWIDGGWNVVFSHDSLIHFFNQESKKDNTKYGVLNLHRNASKEEIKKAYRMYARQWHPDINKEENARAMFEIIVDAYETLIDDTKRIRYDAGLLLSEKMANTSSNTSQKKSTDPSLYTPKIRCGLLYVSAYEAIGFTYVHRILSWEDLRNQQGDVLSSYLDAQTGTPIMQWTKENV